MQRCYRCRILCTNGRIDHVPYMSDGIYVLRSRWPNNSVELTRKFHKSTKPANAFGPMTWHYFILKNSIAVCVNKNWILFQVDEHNYSQTIICLACQEILVHSIQKYPTLLCCHHQLTLCLFDNFCRNMVCAILNPNISFYQMESWYIWTGNRYRDI